MHLDNTSWIEQGAVPEEIYTQIDFENLWELHPHKDKKGSGDLPRWQETYLGACHMPGLNTEGRSLPEEIKSLYDWGNTFLPLDQCFNHVLVNWYENGNDYMGPHSDDAPILVPDAPILSISLGAERTFVVRDKQRTIRLRLRMLSGSYLLMGGQMQRYYTHEVPKEPGSGRRINISFRLTCPSVPTVPRPPFL